MPAPLLRLTKINKSFGAIRALREVCIELLPGEVHALVGENGAGKSTLVQVITGAQRPDNGLLEVGGSPVENLTPARARQLGIACIYQHPALFPDLSVAENIGLRLRPYPALRQVDSKNQRQMAQRLLARVGSETAPETFACDLSMPQQQLVEIACALGANARVVIMDEPTASLTQREQHLLFAVVRDLRHEGAGVIYVSHRLEEVFALADRVTILRDGENVHTSPAGELTTSSLIRFMVGREVTSERRATQLRPLGSGESPREAGIPATATQEAISLKNVGCSVAGLRNISFEIRAGEILGLGGLVGAGRTELARTLFGLTPADKGEILLAGNRVVIDSPRAAIEHGIAYVPEDRAQHGVILELPVEQNISLAIHDKIFPGGWLRGPAERQLATGYIRALDLKPPVPQALASSLSGGNQQKVSVARWLATKPKILILDEPTQGVDIGAKSEIHTIIDGLARQGLAVLLISSDLPELMALSDRIGVMREGTLVALLPGKSDPHDVMSAAFGKAGTTQ